MHGIFFHYFKGEGHIDCQGALSQSEFHRLLDYIEKKHRIIDAESFCERVSNGCREENTVCLCFSCGLRSQYDIALPVLEQRGIKAFWMLYSNMLTGADVLIEIYHHFRFMLFQTWKNFIIPSFPMSGITRNGLCRIGRDSYPSLRIAATFHGLHTTPTTIAFLSI